MPFTQQVFKTCLPSWKHKQKCCLELKIITVLLNIDFENSTMAHKDNKNKVSCQGIGNTHYCSDYNTNKQD